MNRLLASAALLAFAAACSKDQNVNSTQTQRPSEPTGSIVGVVTSLKTGLPLAGVAVTAPSPVGVVGTTTDGNGAYALGGLPAGTTYQVRFSAAAHVTAFRNALISNTAGDFPSNGIAQLDVALPQADATVAGHVYARFGAPAQGVVLMVDLRNQGYDLVATATTLADGSYSMSGLPGAPMGLTISIVAQPWDANADGLADYESVARTAVAYPGAKSLLDFDLRVAPAALLLLTSNLESGKLDPAAQIRLTFNRELDPTLTAVTLYDSTARREVAVQTSLDPTSKILTIFPAGGTPLAANHDYMLEVWVTATNGDPLYVPRSFLTYVATSLLPPVTGVRVTPLVVDWNTTTFTLSWDLNLDASGYQVWVRDTSRNPSYLLAGTLGATASTVVTLPGTFDYYVGDGIQTPFAFGVKVDFVVVAVNAAGDAASPATVTPERRADSVPPTITIVSQSGDANNTGTTAKTVTLSVTFSEYMDKTVAPSILLPVAGETATFAWNANGRGGVFTITIPASTNGRGSYTISSANDTSGNLMVERVGALTSTTELVINGDFEAGSLAGWTTGATLTSTAPVATNAVAASGLWSARVGNASVVAQSGLSTMYQTVTLPTGATSIVASARYRPYSDWPVFGNDTSSCVIRDSTGTTTLATIFSTYANITSFTPASVNITGLAGQTIRVWCQTNQLGWDVTGMYLDDVSILATL